MGRQRSDSAGEVFSTRLPPELRARLQRAADKKGHSLGNEIRNRLIRSFDVDTRIAESFGDRRTYAFFRLLDLCRPLMKSSEKKARGHWLDDRDQYAQVEWALRLILLVLAPKRRKRHQPKEHMNSAVAGVMIAGGALAAVKDPLGTFARREKMTKELREFGYEIFPETRPQEPIAQKQRIAALEMNREINIHDVLGDVLKRAPDVLARSPAVIAELKRRPS